ncbi:MAG TPA: DUF2442 domain-containing protein [Candidatus Deferrimicrobium sp.]|nr:DUF2442 domain-containing protein [Candidatus Deferrimicrobium sp.]
MSPTIFREQGYRFFFFSREVEVTNISLHGLWLYVNGKEYFLPYEDYPWFKEARVSEIHDVKLYHGDHLFWPKIDVDLAVDSLEHPEQFPLIYQ